MDDAGSFKLVLHLHQITDSVIPKDRIFPKIPHKIEKCFKHCTAQPDKIYTSLYDEFLTKCLSNSRSEFIDDFTYTFNELKFTQIHLLFHDCQYMI